MSSSLFLEVCRAVKEFSCSTLKSSRWHEYAFSVGCCLVRFTQVSNSLYYTEIWGENSVSLINSFAFTSSWIGNLTLAPYTAFVVNHVLQVGKDSWLSAPLHKRVIREAYLELGVRTPNTEMEVSQILWCCYSPAA